MPKLVALAVALAAPTGLAHASDTTLFDGARVAAIVHSGAENTPLAIAGVLWRYYDLAFASTAKPLVVRLRIAPPLDAAGVTFAELDRIVSIYATHMDARSGGWEVLNGLGHTGASLRSALDVRSVDPADAAALAAAPSATYRFATGTAADMVSLIVYALPTMPITSANGLRVAVSIDGAASVVLDLATEEFSQAWRQSVLRNTAIGRVGNLRLAPGRHLLTVRALDPGVMLDRFEIAFTGAKQAYLPVPETRVRP